MDMHYHLVYSLGRALYPEGHRCTGKSNCPSNDHSNAYGEAVDLFFRKAKEQGEERLYGYTTPEEKDQHERMSAFVAEQTADGGPLGHTKGRMHRDGGYALKKVSI
jgi:hypothetical protein